MNEVGRAARTAWEGVHARVSDPFAEDMWSEREDGGGMADVVQVPVYRAEMVTAQHIDEAIHRMFDPENVRANEESRRLCLHKAKHYLAPTTNLDDVDPNEMLGFLGLCDITDPLVDRAQERVRDYLTYRRILS